MLEHSSPVIIVGSGIAGLAAALYLAPRPVWILTRGRVGGGTATGWAQGGIAAALSSQDSIEKHVADTLKVGRGLCEEEVVRKLLQEAPSCISDLEKWGITFDRDPFLGGLALGLEGGHCERRIVHAGGDRTGLFVLQGLVDRVKKTPSILLLEEHQVCQIATQEGRVRGIYGQHLGTSFFFPAHAVILATGGLGGLYRSTTNPLSALGSGLALALLAGARLCDVEFVQFHPTALAIGEDPMPLATEALRGEGAFLINNKGERFLEHKPQAELSGRDIVAQAIWHELRVGRQTFLDLRHLKKSVLEHFSFLYKLCLEKGIDPQRDLIPVRPAAHYHVGGIAVDLSGKTSVDGLFACGEVASTGLHGANRLASNSMLEGVACAKLLAQNLPTSAFQNPVPSSLEDAPHKSTETLESLSFTRDLLEQDVGLVRTEESLKRAIFALCPKEFLRNGNLNACTLPTVTALALAIGALRRPHSIGCHVRGDDLKEAPQTERQHTRHFLTAEDITHTIMHLLENQN